MFKALLKGDAVEAEPAAMTPFPRHFDGAEARWKTILAQHAFGDPDKAFPQAVAGWRRAIREAYVQQFQS